MRVFAVGYLQENMFTLPNLPNRDKVLKLQKERAEYLVAKAAEEKAERERAMKKRLESSKLLTQSPETRHASVDTSPDSAVAGGWGPVAVNQTDSSTDPMIEQIQIIKNYIKQAKAENRMEEVQTLERNLLELQSEYMKSQRRY